MLHIVQTNDAPYKFNLQQKLPTNIQMCMIRTWAKRLA